MAKVDAKHSGPNFWERLQPRERVLVMALVMVFFVMGTAVMMFLRFTKLSAIDEEIADRRQGLDLTRAFGPSWKEKLAKPKTKDSAVAFKASILLVVILAGGLGALYGIDYIAAFFSKLF